MSASRQPELQVSQPPPLPVHLPPLAFFFSLINLLFLTAHPTPQAIQLQKLRLPHRRHLALQRHPHRVEHPRRYPVFLDVLALLRHRRPARRHDGEQLMLHLPIQRRIRRQRGIANRTVNAFISRDAGLVRPRLREITFRRIGRLTTTFPVMSHLNTGSPHHKPTSLTTQPGTRPNATIAIAGLPTKSATASNPRSTLPQARHPDPNHQGASVHHTHRPLHLHRHRRRSRLPRSTPTPRQHPGHAIRRDSRPTSFRKRSASRNPIRATRSSRRRRPGSTGTRQRPPRALRRHGRRRQKPLDLLQR